jgi:hypothetical protein
MKTYNNDLLYFIFFDESPLSHTKAYRSMQEARDYLETFHSSKHAIILGVPVTFLAEINGKDKGN